LKAPRRSIAVGLMLVAPVLWSIAGVVTRHMEQAGSFEMVFWRSLFAAAFVSVAWFVLERGGPWHALRTAGRAGLFSGAMWAVMFTAFVVALTLTSTANVLVTMSIAPLLTAVAARLFLSDPIPTRTWLAVLAASAGLAWMLGAGFQAQQAGHAAGHTWGMLIALLVPIASAANLVMLRRAHARVNMVPAVMMGGVLSCVIALPFMFPLSATGRDLALLGVLGVFQLGLPCMLFVIASRALLAPELALLALLEVLLGPFWAWLGAGEVPGRATLMGGAIVLAALVANELAALHGRHASRRSTTAR
jgi:drug/metabolite transporter (DMT)-like permease